MKSKYISIKHLNLLIPCAKKIRVGLFICLCNISILQESVTSSSMFQPVSLITSWTTPVILKDLTMSVFLSVESYTSGFQGQWSCTRSGTCVYLQRSSGNIEQQYMHNRGITRIIQWKENQLWEPLKVIGGNRSGEVCASCHIYIYVLVYDNLIWWSNNKA